VAIAHAAIRSHNRRDGATYGAGLAYRSRQKFLRPDGTVADYTHRAPDSVDVHGMKFGGPHAEDWRKRCKTSAQPLADAAESAENRCDAMIARDFDVALPAELPLEGKRELAEAIAEAIADEHACAVGFALHPPGRSSDKRNWHVHNLLTTRHLGTEGQLGDKIDAFRFEKGKSSRAVLQLRAIYERLTNETLERYGLDVRISAGRLADSTQRRPQLSRSDVRREREAWKARHGTPPRCSITALVTDPTGEPVTERGRALRAQVAADAPDEQRQTVSTIEVETLEERPESITEMIQPKPRRRRRVRAKRPPRRRREHEAQASPARQVEPPERREGASRPPERSPEPELTLTHAREIHPRARREAPRRPEIARIVDQGPTPDDRIRVLTTRTAQHIRAERPSATPSQIGKRLRWIVTHLRLQKAMRVIGQVVPRWTTVRTATVERDDVVERKDITEQSAHQEPAPGPAWRQALRDELAAGPDPSEQRAQQARRKQRNGAGAEPDVTPTTPPSPTRGPGPGLSL